VLDRSISIDRSASTHPVGLTLYNMGTYMTQVVESRIVKLFVFNARHPNDNNNTNVTSNNIMSLLLLVRTTMGQIRLVSLLLSSMGAIISGNSKSKDSVETK